MITDAKISHISEILKIEKESFDKPWRKDHFVNDLNNCSTKNWVFIKNFKVVGYLFGMYVMDEYHIHNIAVDKFYRRLGIAKNLFSNIINFSENQKVNSIFLEVNAINLSARNLYENIGFVEYGERANYYGKNNSAILYKMSL